MNGLTRFEQAGVIFIGAMLIFVALRFALPASHWMEIHRMDVRDAATWPEVTVDYDRTFHRPFPGGYRVEVDLMDGNTRTLLCTTDLRLVNYDPDRVLPDPVTWEWFAGTVLAEAECILPETGDFLVHTTWVGNPGSWLWERTVQRQDRFRVGSP